MWKIIIAAMASWFISLIIGILANYEEKGHGIMWIILTIIISIILILFADPCPIIH